MFLYPIPFFFSLHPSLLGARVSPEAAAGAGWSSEEDHPAAQTRDCHYRERLSQPQAAAHERSGTLYREASVNILTFNNNEKFWILFFLPAVYFHIVAQTCWIKILLSLKKMVLSPNSRVCVCIYLFTEVNILTFLHL